MDAMTASSDSIPDMGGPSVSGRPRLARFVGPVVVLLALVTSVVAAMALSAGQAMAQKKTLAVVDHNVPTSDRSLGIDDPESKLQVETLAMNAKDFGVEYYDEHDKRYLDGVASAVGCTTTFTITTTFTTPRSFGTPAFSITAGTSLPSK